MGRDPKRREVQLRDEKVREEMESNWYFAVLDPLELPIGLVLFFVVKQTLGNQVFPTALCEGSTK